jgi:hypothetical protein
MRIIVLLLVAGCCLLPVHGHAYTSSGTISADETWSGTVSLTGDVTVLSVKLTILPGTVINGNRNDLKIRDNGVIYAAGTPGSPIQFTGVLQIYEALKKDRECLLKHCRLTNSGSCPLEFRNPAGVTELSYLRIEDCAFYNASYTLLYVTSGGSPDLVRCSFNNAASGVFVHGGDTVRVSYCTFTNMSCGIISGGLGGTPKQFYEPMLCLVDHCSFYDISGTRFSAVDVANGYAICTVNYGGVLTVTNSIIENCVNGGVRDYNIDDANNHRCTPTCWGLWSVTLDYNCYYDCGVYGPAKNGLYIGAHSLEVDPRMVQPATGNFSLAAGSPCRNAANDGTSMGAWQIGDIGIDDVVRHQTAARPIMALAPSVFADGVDVTMTTHQDRSLVIRNSAGALVRTMTTNAGRAHWDGRDARGRHVPAGIYYMTAQTENGLAMEKIVKVE